MMNYIKDIALDNPTLCNRAANGIGEIKLEELMIYGERITNEKKAALSQNRSDYQLSKNNSLVI